MDYNNLLQPISSESNVGDYLKNDRSAYRSLRNNFNAAQSSFRRLTETPESSGDEVLFEENQKNWQLVHQTCWETLTEKSKDIEIYCWWVMSLSFQDKGIIKIASALSTLVSFVETFWPEVHPYLPTEKLKSTDEAEQAAQRAEMQLRPLIQLLGESVNSGLLFMPLQMMPLVAEIDHAQYFSATKAGTLPALKQQASKNFTSHQTDISETVSALDLAINALKQLDVWLKATMSGLNIIPISTSFLEASLNDNLQAIKYLVGDSFNQWPLDKVTEQVSNSQAEETVERPSETQAQLDTPSTSTQTPATAQATSSQQKVLDLTTTNNLSNREHAFQELRVIADYFAKSEPHSPISFLLEKAIRWGHMSLPDLMLELLSGNDKILNQINLVAGLADEKTELAEVIPQNNNVTNDSTNKEDSFITKNSQAEVVTPSVQQSDTEQDTPQEKPSPTEDFTW